jgi:hypothetical protein
MSGARSSKSRSTMGMRNRTELMFQVAIVNVMRNPDRETRPGNWQRVARITSEPPRQAGFAPPFHS